MKYSIITLENKPSEYFFNSDEELKEWLKKAWNNELDNNIEFYEDFDFKVYNDSGEDIGESQFIQELIGECTNEND